MRKLFRILTKLALKRSVSVSPCWLLIVEVAGNQQTWYLIVVLKIEDHIEMSMSSV